MNITTVYNRFNLLIKKGSILKYFILKSDWCNGQGLTIWIVSKELNQKNQNWLYQNTNT